MIYLTKTQSIDDILKPVGDAIDALHREVPSCNGNAVSKGYLDALSALDSAVKQIVPSQTLALTEVIRKELSPGGLIELATNNRKFKEVLKGALDLEAVKFMISNLKNKGLSLNQVNADDLLKTANYNTATETVSTDVASKLAAMLVPEYIKMDSIIAGGNKTIKFNDAMLALAFILQQSASLLADELESVLVNKSSDFRGLMNIVDNVNECITELNNLKGMAVVREDSDLYSYINAMRNRKGLNVAYGQTQVSIINNDLLDDLCNQVETVDVNRPVKYKMVKELIQELKSKLDSLVADDNYLHQYTFEQYLSHMDTTAMEKEMCDELRYIQTTDESLHRIGFNTIEDFVKTFCIKLITAPIESKNLAKFMRGDILSDSVERIPVKSGLYINIDRSETLNKLNEAYKYNTTAMNDLDIDESVRLMAIVMSHINKYIAEKYDFALKVDGTFTSINFPPEKFIILDDVFEKLDKLSHMNGRALLMESVTHQDEVSAASILHKLPELLLADLLSAYSSIRVIGSIGLEYDGNMTNVNALKSLGVDFGTAESGVLPIYNLANIGFGEPTIAYIDFINKYGMKVKLGLDTPLIRKEYESVLVSVMNALGASATAIIPVFDEIDMQIPYIFGMTVYNRIYDLVYVYTFNNIRNNIIEILSHVTGEILEGVNPNGL